MTPNTANTAKRQEGRINLPFLLRFSISEFGGEIWRESPKFYDLRPSFGNHSMPSLIRFIVALGVLAGLDYGGMIALGQFVEPEQREMRVKVPSKRLNP